MAFIDLQSISPTTAKTFPEAKTIRVGEKGCLFDWATSKLLDVIILFLYFTTKYLNSISRPLPCIPKVFSLPATKRIKRSEVLERGKKTSGSRLEESGNLGIYFICLPHLLININWEIATRKCSQPLKATTFGRYLTCWLACQGRSEFERCGGVDILFLGLGESKSVWKGSEIEQTASILTWLISSFDLIF